MPRGKLPPPQTVWLYNRRAFHREQNRSDPATSSSTGSGHLSRSLSLKPTTAPVRLHSVGALTPHPAEHNRARQLRDESLT